MKKIILLIFIMLCLSPVSCSTSDTSDDGAERSDFRYEYSEDQIGYIITEYVGTEESVTVPDVYNGKPVCAIGAEVFAGHTVVREVYIPSTVKNIGEKCFAKCRNLNRVVILSEDDITIGDGCFMESESLISVEIHGELLYLPDRVFVACSSLCSVELPDTLQRIGDGAFAGCTSLKAITIPDTVSMIGESAFWGCSSLERVVLPSSLSVLENNVFTNCKALCEIQIPQATVDIDCSAFSSTSSLQNIHVDVDNPVYISIDGMLINRETKELLCYPCGKKETALTVPRLVTVIGENAFGGENQLLELTLHEDLKEIKSRGGRGCTKLERLTVLSPDVIFDPDAFYRGSITYKNGVETNRTDYVYPFTVYCFENSTAKKYAVNNGIKYELISR